MRTKKEIEEKLIFVYRQIWRNGNDSHVWCKVKDYLEWVLEPKKRKGNYYESI